MQHAQQHNAEGYFDIIALMDELQTIQHGSTIMHIGMLGGEPVTAVYHQSEGVGYVIN